MLSLTRAVDERIYIRTPSGERIIMIVTNIGQGQVKIAFDADRSIEIDREEMLTNEDLDYFDDMLQKQRVR